MSGEKRMLTMLKTSAICVATAGLLFAGQASAHQVQKSWHNHSHGGHYKPKKHKPRPPKFRVNKEQREQNVMIHQGIRNCSITPKEAKRLRKQQQRINKAEARMRQGGLNRHERNKLKQMLHTARVQINRLTKNNKHCRKPVHKPKKHHHKKKHHNHGWNGVVQSPRYMKQHGHKPRRAHKPHRHGHGHKMRRHSHRGVGFHLHGRHGWSISSHNGRFSISIGH